MGKPAQRAPELTISIEPSGRADAGTGAGQCSRKLEVSLKVDDQDGPVGSDEDGGAGNPHHSIFKLKSSHIYSELYPCRLSIGGLDLESQNWNSQN